MPIIKLISESRLYEEDRAANFLLTKQRLLDKCHPASFILQSFMIHASIVDPIPIECASLATLLSD